MPFSLYCSTLPSHTLLLQAGVLPLPHSRVLSWSLLFFFTNPTPVRPTYPFPPLFAACLSRLTLSRQAFECPISCLLDPSVFPSIRAARTPHNHARLCRCMERGISAPWTPWLCQFCCNSHFGQAKALARSPHLAAIPALLAGARMRVRNLRALL